jgi:hypothetical protein
LPEAVKQAGGMALRDLDEKAEMAFRAMLRSIASDTSESDPTA